MPNSARDVYGATRRARAKKRAPQPPPVSVHGPRDSGVQSDANRVRTPPRSTAAFGPVRRADAPITQAARAQRRQTVRAERRLPRRVSPALPVLARPTKRQARVAIALQRRSDRLALARSGTQNLTDNPYVLNRNAKVFGPHGDLYLGDAMNLEYGARQKFLRALRRSLLTDPRTRAAAQFAYGLQDAQQAAQDLREHQAEQRYNKAHPGEGGNDLGGGVGMVAFGGGGSGFTRRGAGDAVALAEAPFVGGYEAGAGAYEAIAHGDTSRLERLAKGLYQGISQSVPGRLVSGDPAGALRSFRQHPGFAALDLAGAESLVGRTAGAAVRTIGSTAESTGVRGALARVGSTHRLPIGLNEDGGLAVAERSGSKDLIRAAAQRFADGRREYLRDASGKVVRVEDPRRRNPVPVLKAKGPMEERLLKTRRADFEASRANAVERFQREQTARDVAKADRGGQVRGRINRKARQAVSMAIEGTLRRDHPESGTTFKADVEKRIAHLEHQVSQMQVPTRAGRGFRSMKGVKSAREELAALRKLRDLSPEQVDRLFAAKDKIARLRVAQDAEQARLGIRDPAELERARLQVYAMAHMDGRHVTVEEHQALERQARVVERQARAAVDAAPAGSAARAQALAEWRKARDTRIETSGRHPGGVRAHENAARQAERARVAHERVKTELAKVERRRRDVAAAQRVRRGNKDAKNVARGQKHLATLDGKIKQLREQERAAGKASRDARSMADSTRLPETQAALRHPDGRHLSNDEIKTHMREHGVDPETIAQLSHKELGNRAHHKRFDMVRPSGGGARRTGSAYQRGESGFGPHQIEDTAANAATTIAKAQQVDRAIADNALKHPALSKKTKLTAREKKIVARGGGFTPKEGLELAKRLEDDSNGRRTYVVVAQHAARVSADQASKIDKLQHPRAFDELSSKLLNDRVVTVDNAKDLGARNVVLMDAQQFNRLARHLQPSGELEKLVQMLNRPFRFSVLAQPRWLAGNFIEPYFVRLPASGSGVINIPGMAMDIARSIKTLRSMERSGDPAVRAAAAEIRAQQLGGLFLGARGASNRRVTKDFEPKPGAGPVEAAAGNVISGLAFIRNMPAVKQLADLIQIPPAAYFKANRVLIEQWAQHAALGRSMRKDLEELYGSWTKAWSLGDAAVKDARRGLMNTSTQERFMRAQHELLGKYEGFSPTVRRLVQTVAPFLPWSLSAARFTFWTMPAHHSLLTSLLTKTSQVVDKSWTDEHKDVPPGGLDLAVRQKDGGWVDLARYTPYGFSGPVAEGDVQGITDQFLPQISGAVAALGGHDPFNRDLRVKPTPGNPKGIPSTGQKVLIALNSLLESTGGPYFSLVRRLQEGGGTAYSDSTFWDPKTKPGSSHMSALRRTLDPFRPTYLHPPAGATSTRGRDPEVDKIRESVGRSRSSAVLGDPAVERIREQVARARGG